MLAFTKNNPMQLSVSALSRVAELSNTKRTDNAAYFTNKYLITEMIKLLPDIDKETVRILEPSVGVGNFVPLILKKFENKNIELYLCDINPDSLQILKTLLSRYDIPTSCNIHFIEDDFLTHDFEQEFDLIIGNPPFYKMKSGSSLLNQYRTNAINKMTTNICSFFLDKSVRIARYVALVFPKFLLNTPEFAPSRAYLARKAIDCIIDFGEKGFPGVLVETIAIFINNTAKPNNTRVISLTEHINIKQKQHYIFDSRFPYWLIYRNRTFDEISKKIRFRCVYSFPRQTNYK